MHDEALRGHCAKRLVNLLFELDKPPLPFHRVNGLPFDGWEGVVSHEGWRWLIATLDFMLAASAALTRTRRAVRRAEGAALRHSEALRDAQIHSRLHSARTRAATVATTSNVLMLVALAATVAGGVALAAGSSPDDMVSKAIAAIVAVAAATVTLPRMLNEGLQFASELERYQW